MFYQTKSHYEIDGYPSANYQGPPRERERANTLPKARKIAKELFKKYPYVEITLQVVTEDGYDVAGYFVESMK